MRWTIGSLITIFFCSILIGCDLEESNDPVQWSDKDIFVSDGYVIFKVTRVD